MRMPSIHQQNELQCDRYGEILQRITCIIRSTSYSSSATEAATVTATGRNKLRDGVVYGIDAIVATEAAIKIVLALTTVTPIPDMLV